MTPKIRANAVSGFPDSEAVRRHPYMPCRATALRATSALTGAALAGVALATGQAWALPQGGTVVEGDATITYSENSVVIDQNSAHVIIEWDSFDTTAGESVHFDQAAFMAALNRILSGEATRFDGALTANGSITIVNAAGIAFGADATVDVGAITATTLDILNSSFMADQLVFDQYDSTFADASVTNDGTITVADQGLAALVGPGVANNGVIQARTGAVVLASGTAATIDFYGDGLVNFALNGATEAAPVDADGKPLDALVDNSGEIYADGGTVILRAEAVGAIVDNAINMGGVIQARSVEGRGGQIALVAGDGAGDVQVAGTLDASAADAGVSGGTVHVLGDAVALNAGADIDVSGPAGGGAVLVGGAAHGAAFGAADVIAGLDAGAYANSSDITYFDAGAGVTADATGSGEGGTVVVWGNSKTIFHGAISAQGANGGDGGFVEVSGAQVVVDGSFDVGNGEVLIDPANTCVFGTGGVGVCASGFTSAIDFHASIAPTLAGGGTISTVAAAGSGEGDIDIAGDLDFNATTRGTWNVTANDDVFIGFLSQTSLAVTGAGLDLNLAAGNGAGATDSARVAVDFASVDLGGGDFSAVADDFDVFAGASLTAGNVTISRLTAGRIALGSIDVTGGQLGLTDSELDRISTPGTLQIGDGTGTEIEVTSAISPLDVGVLALNPGTEIILSASVTTPGAQTYDGPVTLNTNAVLTSTGGGDVTFNSTIDGLFNLTVNTAGVTLFESSIGTTTRIGDLTTDADGSTTLRTLTLRTSGTMTFNDPVTGVGGLIIDSNQGGGDTTFAGTVDGGDWIIAEPSNLTFGGAVGGTTPLTNLQLTSPGGTVAINGGLIRTTNILRLRGNLVFDSATDTTTLESTGGAQVRLGENAANTVRSATDGEESVIVNTTGTTQINGVVGDNNQRLKALTTDADGTTELNGGALTLAGNTLTFNDAVVLGVNTLITDAGAVTFNNTIDGAFALTIDAGGNVTFGDAAADAVGGTTPLASLAATSGGTIFVNAPITTADAAVTFSADIMAIAAAINAGGGIVTLAPLTAGKTISLGTEVGGSLSLSDPELDLINAAILRIGSAAAGSITFNAAISPAGTDTLSLTTGDSILDTNGGGADVEVANLAIRAVNGIADNQTLEVSVGTLAALNTTDGAIDVIETFAGGNLIIGIVDGLAGVVNQGAAPHPGLRSIAIETNNGDLTVAAGSPITAEHGGIFLVAQHENGGAGDRTFTNNAAITMEAGNGQIEIIANNMDLGSVAGGSSITALNGARVVLNDDPSSSSTIAIDLGGADGVNTLGLTDEELDTVSTAGVLQIGHSGSGDITISSPISLDPAKVATLDLETGGSLVVATLATPNITVENLALRLGDGGGAVIDVDNLAYSNAAGFLLISDPDDLTVAAVDGLASSTNAGILGTAISTTGVLTFAVDTSDTVGSGTYLAGTSIDVANGVTVSSGLLLSFEAPTVNLDGDLFGTAGISGNAITVNVLGDTGGAEVQDAVFVARAGALANENVTINIAAGTYASFVVPFSHPNLTIIGAGNDAGSITTIETGSPAITIAANGTTIQDMALTVGAGIDVGILLDGATTPFLTGINIVNVDFTGLSFGVLSTGNIGSGAGGTDVTIRGNSSADRAVFEDITQAAIAAGDVDNDAVYLIQDLILQDGSDADALASAIDGIQLGSIGAATIQGVNMTHNAGFDGIFVGPTLTNATILIGGPDADDANTIRGLSDGIDTADLSGGSFVVQGNDLIFGDDDAIDVDGTIGNGADVRIVDNAEITGSEDGLDIGAITNATLIVSGNTLIRGIAQNAVEFEGAIRGASTVTISENTDLLGAVFGIAFRDSIGGTAVVTVDENGTATHNGAAYDGTAQVNLANFLVTGAITGGISVHDITGAAAVTVSRNMISGGGDNGVEFDSIGSTGTTAVHNNFILDNGGNGIAFGGDITGPTEVFQNFIARNGGNGVLVDATAGIGTGNLVVQQNFLADKNSANGNGGFGFSMLGAGTPDIEANWWGSAFLDSIQLALNGVAVPALVLAAGTDTNVPAAGFGASGLDPFAFQNQFVISPIVLGPDVPGFDATALLLLILQQTDTEAAVGDALAGRAGLTADNTIDSVFDDPFNIFGNTDFANLAPAAGGAGCQLIPIEDGLRLTCNGGGAGSPADLEPGAGGDTTGPAPAIDPGLSLEFLLDVWLERTGGTPQQDTPSTNDDEATLPVQAAAMGPFLPALIAELR